MDAQRFEERKEEYARAVAQLRRACAEAESEFLRDAVIQRFEFCWELAWKMLMPWLRHLGVEANNPRETFRQALLLGLITDGNGWSDLQKMRNLTSHTYDEALARQVYHQVVHQGLPLFTRLAESSASWRLND